MLTLPTAGVGETCEGCVDTICMPAANARSSLIFGLNIDTQALQCSWTDPNLTIGDGVSEQLRDYTVTVVLYGIYLVQPTISAQMVGPVFLDERVEL